MVLDLQPVAAAVALTFSSFCIKIILVSLREKDCRFDWTFGLIERSYNRLQASNVKKQESAAKEQQYNKPLLHTHAFEIMIQPACQFLELNNINNVKKGKRSAHTSKARLAPYMLCRKCVKLLLSMPIRVQNCWMTDLSCFVVVQFMLSANLSIASLCAQQQQADSISETQRRPAHF